MSFRLRALGLVMILTVATAAATAWLTLRQASRELDRTVTAGQQEVAAITDGLRSYAHDHATWFGVQDEVRALAERTGQRIRVTTTDGAVLADSDVLAGRVPRGVVGPPVLVDLRPVLRLPAGPTDTMVEAGIYAIARYRKLAGYAACLTRAGVPVLVTDDEQGIPIYVPVPGSPDVRCASGGTSDDQRADRLAVEDCAEVPASLLVSCLRQAFAKRTEAIAPQPVQVYLGAADESAPSLSVGPSAAVASGVAIAAILVALLLARRVLRPVDALIGASRGVGAGDLGHRVPVTGQDEIAELGRAFNRMADSLQQSEERQRRLVADVAHELRTPLANLRGYLEALRDGVVAPSPDVMASLHEEVLLQQRVVEDLQDLALAEAGRLTYHRRAVHAAELLDGCLAAHGLLAGAAGVALDVEPGADGTVDADPDRLRQVLGNLVTNAVRATPRGGAVVLSAWRTGDEVRIRVADSGAGIAPEDLPHVFDRFWRADAARARATGGSGLGLAIARQIVADHGGTIEVESTVGSGTAFTVALPAAPDVTEPRAPRPGPAGSP